MYLRNNMSNNHYNYWSENWTCVHKNFRVWFLYSNVVSKKYNVWLDNLEY